MLDFFEKCLEIVLTLFQLIYINLGNSLSLSHAEIKDAFSLGSSGESCKNWNDFNHLKFHRKTVCIFTRTVKKYIQYIFYCA